jgi:hypothetical protein
MAATPLPPRRPDDDRQRIRRAVDHLLARRGGAAGDADRREAERVDFVTSVSVRTEDGGEFTCLSRDLSPAGIRLVGTRRLLGQKVRVRFPDPAGGKPLTFLVRVLWTCTLGEGLIENGGMFLDAPDEPAGNP